MAAIEENLGLTLSLLGRYDEAIQYLDAAATKYHAKGELNALIRVTAHIGSAQKYRLAPDDGIAYTQRVLGELQQHEPPLTCHRFTYPSRFSISEPGGIRSS